MVSVHTYFNFEDVFRLLPQKVRLELRRKKKDIQANLKQFKITGHVFLAVLDQHQCFRNCLIAKLSGTS